MVRHFWYEGLPLVSSVRSSRETIHVKIAVPSDLVRVLPKGIDESPLGSILYTATETIVSPFWGDTDVVVPSPHARDEAISYLVETFKAEYRDWTVYVAREEAITA